MASVDECSPPPGKPGETEPGLQGDSDVSLRLTQIFSSLAPPPARLPRAMPPTSPRVLLVDDDPGVLESLKLLLCDDCEVTTSASPADALSLATSASYDVIVTDYRMPQMTGAEFAHALKERLSPVPYCLLLTGTPNEVKPSMPGASELVMVLAKPFDPERLLKLVLQVGRLGVNRRGAARPA